MDAIECGIVKIPRVPVSDNALGYKMPVWRKLWPEIREDLPKKGAKKAVSLDPEALPEKLLGALHALYEHYEKIFEQ
jgi:type III restriction enzyme